MRCYEDHVLLAYLDGELKSEGMAVERHLKECNDCQARLRILAEDEQFLEGVLSEHLEEVDLSNAFKEESWIRLKLQLNSAPKQKQSRSLPVAGRGKSRATAVAAVMLLLVGSLFFGGIRSAVADFLSMFRMDRIDTMAVTAQEMAQIENAFQDGQEIEIAYVGTLKMVGFEEAFSERSLDEAAEMVDFTIIQPDLRGYDGPQVSVKKLSEINLTLNVPGINSMINNLGGTSLLPSELDQRTVTIISPPQVSLSYQSSVHPAVFVVQMRNPELMVPGGVEKEKVKNALLSLPFWPDRIKKQLEGIDDWKKNIVIPENADIQTVTVRGNQGITWSEPETSSEATGNTVCWSENGIIYGLSGRMPLEEILEIAEGMK